MTQPRILVIDDSLTVRKLVELSFRSGGCQVEFAGSGGEALAKARLLRPNLVLLDYVLPDMKGTDLCQLLAADEGLRDVPVVVMSAKQASLRERFREFPAVVSFLQKPFSVEGITGCVAGVLQRSQSAAGSSSGGGETSFTHAQKEAAAKAIYARLSSQFARIPEWLPRLGEANPSTFFGKKILSPSVMDQLLAALLPICGEILASSGSAGPPAAASPDLGLDATYHRSAEFSRKVQTVELSPRERQLLSLVDGRRTIANIVAQTRMKGSQALSTLRRMEELDLVRPGPAAGPAPGQTRTAPKVLIFEPDARIFRRQLERLLRERADPLEMIAVSRAEELAPSVAREPPRLVLLNVPAIGDKAMTVVPAVREASAGAATKIAAIFEMPAQGRQFSVAGVDAVFVKPIPYADIDALLTTGGFS